MENNYYKTIKWKVTNLQDSHLSVFYITHQLNSQLIIIVTFASEITFIKLDIVVDTSTNGRFRGIYSLFKKIFD